jgi:hypothetical protein
MKIEKLIGEVAARNGIRIEPDDPAFALVTLNQLILEEVVQNLVDQIRAATADFELAAERVQSRAGAMLAKEISGRATDSEASTGREVGTTRRRAALWFGFGALFGAVLLTLSAWLGRQAWPCG